MATAQEQMKAKLQGLGLPSRNIDVYGSQIVVTCASSDAAVRWASVLGKFAKVRKAAAEGLDETKESTPVAKQYVKVWRTWAVV